MRKLEESTFVGRRQDFGGEERGIGLLNIGVGATKEGRGSTRKKISSGLICDGSGLAMADGT